MATRRRFLKKSALGFTLVELLLVVALLMALLGAIVYNFAAARKGAELDEGVRQFETLARWAGSYAASNGRAVQFRFETGEVSTNSSASSNPELATLRVMFEIDPVYRPGEFIDVAEAAALVESINDRVRIESVNGPSRPANISTNEMSLEQTNAPLPAITFFADGSTESAEIVLASNDGEDFRRATIRLDGVTGGIRSEIATPADLAPAEWTGDQPSRTAAVASEPSDVFESPTTRSETIRTNYSGKSP